MLDQAQASTNIVFECVDQEIVDVVLDPYRLQDVAIKACAERADCVQFLKNEAVRISRQPTERFEKLNSVALWGEILKYSGIHRIPPTRLEDLPLNEDPRAVFEKLKEARLAARELNKNDSLKFACAGLAAIVGPGKFKAVTAVKATGKLYRVQPSSNVEKLFNKHLLPEGVKEKFLRWVKDVENKGLEEARRTPGYHDKSVKGLPNRRSVRLTDAFRACYEIIVENGISVLNVITISSDHNFNTYCR